MKQAYRLLLRLYPYDFRAAFAAGMLAAFERGGGQGRARELAGLVRGVAFEWFAKWTTDPIDRGRILPDVRLMRPPGITRTEWFGRV
jgi:hypothetical protein